MHRIINNMENFNIRENVSSESYRDSLNVFEISSSHYDRRNFQYKLSIKYIDFPLDSEKVVNYLSPTLKCWPGIDDITFNLNISVSANMSTVFFCLNFDSANASFFRMLALDFELSVLEEYSRLQRKLDFLCNQSSKNMTSAASSMWLLDKSFLKLFKEMSAKESGSSFGILIEFSMKNSLSYPMGSALEKLPEAEFEEFALNVADYDLISSDIKLLLGKCIFHVHKYVLSKVSGVFNEILMEQQMFKSGEESVQIIEIDYDFTFQAFQHFLFYIYTKNIGDILHEDLTKIIVELYVLAEKYKVNDLKAYCENHLIEMLNEANLKNYYVLSQLLGSVNLMNAVKSITTEKAFMDMKIACLVQLVS